METHNGTGYIIWIDTNTPITAERGLNYRPVMCGISNGFRMSRESVSYRNKCDEGWDATESGYGSWSIDLSGHAISLLATDASTKANFQEVGMLLVNKTKCWCKMSDLDDNIVREGVVRVGDFSESADMEEPYSFDASFVGIGKPIFEGKNAPLPPGLLQVFYGSLDSYQILTYEKIISSPLSVAIMSNLTNVTIPYAVPEAKFFWFAKPRGYDIYDAWFDKINPNNEGFVGSYEDWFGPTNIVEGAINYDFYIANYPTEYYFPEEDSGITFKKL